MKTISRMIALAIVSAAVLLSACNTIRGAGQDIEDVGESIEDAAD